jgi:uncharacterized protein involved in exopolysaccharide biosynthesis
MDEGQINRIKQYLVVIGRGISVVVIVFVLTLFSGIYVVDHLFSRAYSASALVEVKPRAETGSGIESDRPAEETPLSWRDEAEVMKSPHLLMPVIQKLGLDRAWKDQLPPAPNDGWAANEAITHLQEILKIELKPGTNILKITASSENPEEAADIANDVADQYKLQRDREESERNDQEQDQINDQIDRQQQVVAEKKAGLEELRDGLEAKGIQIVPETGKHELGELQIYHAAQRDLERQKALLDAFTLHLRQVSDAGTMGESPVRIIDRAVAPALTSRPNRHFEMMTVLALAILLSVGFASSVEVVFLLLRAAKRPEN